MLIIHMMLSWRLRGALQLVLRRPRELRHVGLAGPVQRREWDPDRRPMGLEATSAVGSHYSNLVRRGLGHVVLPEIRKIIAVERKHEEKIY